MVECRGRFKEMQARVMSWQRVEHPCRKPFTLLLPFFPSFPFFPLHGLRTGPVLVTNAMWGGWPLLNGRKSDGFGSVGVRLWASTEVTAFPHSHSRAQLPRLLGRHAISWACWACWACCYAGRLLVGGSVCRLAGRCIRLLLPRGRKAAS